NGGDVDDLGVLQAPLDVADARLGQPLLFAGGVVLGVFLQVAQLAGLGDGRADLRALDFQLLEFLFQGASALDGHRVFRHALIPACKSCSRRTVRSGPNLMASHTAWPPARVVVMQTLCCRALRRME